jgi:hypothetical protein
MTNEPEVGDIVEIISNLYGHDFEIGQKVRLTYHYQDTSWKVELLDGSDYWVVEQEEFKLVESVSEEPQVKVGDKVKVINDAIFHPSVKLGDIGTITRNFGNRSIEAKCETWSHSQQGTLGEDFELLQESNDKPSQEENDDWIEWNGGECPIPNDTLHEVKLRSGTISKDRDPQTWAWYRSEDQSYYGDIIAYRILPSQKVLGDVSEEPATTILLEVDSSYNQGKSLVEVIKHVSYKVTIKGMEFELTEEEYHELVSQLRNEM